MSSIPMKGSMSLIATSIVKFIEGCALFSVAIKVGHLQRERGIKIELCVKLRLLRLFLVGHVVQNRWSALSLALHESFSLKGKEWKIYCSELALLSEPQIWQFHVVVCQTTSKHCTKKRATRAARSFFFIQPIKSLICVVVVDLAVVKS